eukprot:2682704-Pleurochrysis_carterae.AAC.1
MSSIGRFRMSENSDGRVQVTAAIDALAARSNDASGSSLAMESWTIASLHTTRNRRCDCALAVMSSAGPSLCFSSEKSYRAEESGDGGCCAAALVAKLNRPSQATHSQRDPSKITAASKYVSGPYSTSTAK